MALGLIALLLAGGAAGWLLMRIARPNALDGKRTFTVLKIVVWLGLVAALLAARLWPLAFMVLLAAGGVMAIEAWRDTRIPRASEPEPKKAQPPATVMSVDEAAAVLGVGSKASAEEVRTAHRKLIGQLHPDKGGSDYLASKINAARDLLIGEASRRDNQPPS
ncbi:MAG: DnaJ domain-containing protein [Pseudomonadota bacterium]